MWMQEAVGHTQMYEVAHTAPVLRDTPGTQPRADMQRIWAQLQAEIARRQSLETQLQHMQALHTIDLWAGSLAHEIKNPLTSIRTFVQLVSLKRHDYSFVEKFERIVLQELDRIDHLVNELLQLAKPPCLHRTLGHLPPVLHRVVEVNSERLHLQGVVLTTDIATSLPLLDVDTEQLYRAFANIMLNAIEAMPAGGALHLSCQLRPERHVNTAADGESVEIIFRDTGVGMSSEQLRTLFTPFQTTKPTGTGLGLALTHKILEAHGGTIQFTSAAGHGTVVIVTLPASSPHRMPTA